MEVRKPQPRGAREQPCPPPIQPILIRDVPSFHSFCTSRLGEYDPKVLSCGNQLYKWLPIDTKNDCVIAARVYPGNECMMTEIRAWIGTKGYRTTVSGELYYCDVDVDKKVCYVVVGEGSVVFGENQVLGFEMEEVEGERMEGTGREPVSGFQCGGQVCCLNLDVTKVKERIKGTGRTQFNIIAM